MTSEQSKYNDTFESVLLKTTRIVKGPFLRNTNQSLKLHYKRNQALLNFVLFEQHNDFYSYRFRRPIRDERFRWNCFSNSAHSFWQIYSVNVVTWWWMTQCRWDEITKSITRVEETRIYRHQSRPRPRRRTCLKYTSYG